MRVAAIDCGTNSLRLLIADLNADLNADLHPDKRDVYREMRVVRLGQGVDQTGRLAPEALERTRVALLDYAETCRELGVERTRLVATSATRDAANRDHFVSMVTEILGVPPDVVTGHEEAELSFAGATVGLEAPMAYLVVDIGGGSTELVLGGDEVDVATSIDVGCVRLTERHLRSDPPTAAEIAAARVDVDAALDRAVAVVPVGMARTAIGLAGSVTTVAAVALNLPSYQPERIHHARISAADVTSVTESLLAMTRAQRSTLPVMHPGRVDVIGGGALVLLAILQRYRLDEVLVSESDILDGIAMSLA